MIFKEMAFRTEMVMSVFCWDVRKLSTISCAQIGSLWVKMLWVLIWKCVHAGYSPIFTGYSSLLHSLAQHEPQKSPQSSVFVQEKTESVPAISESAVPSGPSARTAENLNSLSLFAVNPTLSLTSSSLQNSGMDTSYEIRQRRQSCLTSLFLSRPRSWRSLGVSLSPGWAAHLKIPKLFIQEHRQEYPGGPEMRNWGPGMQQPRIKSRDDSKEGAKGTGL